MSNGILPGVRRVEYGRYNLVEGAPQNTPRPSLLKRHYGSMYEISPPLVFVTNDDEHPVVGSFITFLVSRRYSSGSITYQTDVFLHSERECEYEAKNLIATYDFVVNTEYVLRALGYRSSHDVKSEVGASAKWYMVKIPYNGDPITAQECVSEFPKSSDMPDRITYYEDRVVVAVKAEGIESAIRGAPLVAISATIDRRDRDVTRYDQELRRIKDQLYTLINSIRPGLPLV